MTLPAHARLHVLRLCQRDNTPRSAGEIARAIGSYREHIYHYLLGMIRAGEMERERIAGGRGPERYVYRATRRGLRIDVGQATDELKRLARSDGRYTLTRHYDHRALARALGVPAAAPAPRSPRIVHMEDHR